MPSTIVGNLVEDKIYPDPLVDKNLRLMPGCSYPVGANFSNLRCRVQPFGFHCGIALSFASLQIRGKMLVELQELTSRQHLLIGKQIATSDQIAGTFRTHDLNSLKLRWLRREYLSGGSRSA